jgi:2-amino-4-hydroxy-6-hydroxymethyldihydropteridine diphosphokinase
VPIHKNIYLGLGSNQGDREKNLLLAIKKINTGAGTVVAVSPVYQAEPWGKTDQPEFLNQVIALETSFQPRELLAKLLAIESGMGRTRDVHWGPRTIDLDILFFGERIINESDLTIPHPGIADRNFVLMPLNELAADLIHPLLQKTCRQLLKECKDPLTVKLFDPR